MTDTTTPPERYTSYHHPEKTFSLLDKAREYAKERNLVFFFEYRGLAYSIISDDRGQTTLYCDGPKTRFLMSLYDTDDNPEGELPTGTLATFRVDEFDDFIRTYEIEGKTLEWILEHQREWKYKMDAEHVEQHAGSFTFAFVYRQIPCLIDEYVSKCAIAEYASKRRESESEYTEGFYIYITPGVLFDVTPYAPVTPGAKHWTEGFIQIEGNDASKITLGPYATTGEILDRIRFSGKTLRVIFDTEYDDGEVLCGEFGV